MKKRNRLFRGEYFSVEKKGRSLQLMPKTVLEEEDKIYLTQRFEEEIVPRLKKYQARVGSIGCEFAGEEYSPWLIHFRAKGMDFEILEFEYDENARSPEFK